MQQRKNGPKEGKPKGNEADAVQSGREGAREITRAGLDAVSKCGLKRASTLAGGGHGSAVVERRLGEIASLRSGIYVSPGPMGRVACLQVSDFDEAGQVKSGLRRDYVLTGSQDRHLLAGGEVLLGCKGTSNRAVMVPEDCLPAVASTSFLVIQSLDTRLVLTGYLAWWLNTPEVQRVLKDKAKGTNIVSLSREEVAGLMLDIPPLDVQAAVVGAQTAADKLLRLYRDLAAQEHLLISLKLKKAIKR